MGQINGVVRQAVGTTGVGEEMMVMGLFSWLVVGGIAGWLASMLAGANAKMGLVANIVIGIVGAMLGGFILGIFGIGGVSGFNLWSILVATLGAFVLIYVIRAIKK